MRRPSGVSRRNFLVNMIGGLGSVPLLVDSLKKNSLENDQKARPQTRIVRTLAKTGLKAPIVGMGVMNADNPALIRASFELGVRHFDTAAYYQQGRNEEMVGSVLKEIGGRKEAIIATKIYVPHPLRSMTAQQAKEFYLKTADESLKRLQTDYVDILYNHSVNENGWLNQAGVLEALQILKKQGKARFIGFSTHENMAEVIADATNTGLYEVILTTFNYSLAEDVTILKTLRQAEAKGIGLIAMKTQCQQDWYREKIETVNKKIYQQYYSGNLMNKALLKWVLQHPFIAWAIPGYVNFEQMEEDFTVASDLAYSLEEKKFLLDRQVKIAMKAVCRRCRLCRDKCPKGVDIAELVRVHMYAASYRNFVQARQVLAEIPADRGLEICRECNECQAVCSGNVQIARRIAELKSIFV
jgi:uncharacterized protein